MNRAKILVIDDNQGILFIMREALKIKKYEVETCDNYCGIDLIEKMSPDLIFLDVSLGDKNGCDLCREIKENESTKNIPVIILTGYSNGHKLAKEALADGHISKPFELINLWAIISKQLK